MTEYETLNHMRRVIYGEPPESWIFYLPHHAVFRNDDLVGKIRVVFNASFTTSSGFSLNDKLLAGPTLLTLLWIVVTRWRFFCVAFKTDIVKMFRQILVHPDDID